MKWWFALAQIGNDYFQSIFLVFNWNSGFISGGLWRHLGVGIQYFWWKKEVKERTKHAEEMYIKTYSSTSSSDSSNSSSSSKLIISNRISDEDSF